MARKETVFVVTKAGRDNGKRFHIKEMPSRQAEKWAARALLALARTGVDIENIQGTGWAGMAMAGVKALQYMEFGEAEPLLDEMMDSITIEPDPKVNPGFIRPLVDNLADGNDIEEMQTRIDLRVAWFKLHADFFLNAETSKTS